MKLIKIFLTVWTFYFSSLPMREGNEYNIGDVPNIYLHVIKCILKNFILYIGLTPICSFGTVLKFCKIKNLKI